MEYLLMAVAIGFFPFNVFLKQPVYHYFNCFEIFFSLSPRVAPFSHDCSRPRNMIAALSNFQLLKPNFPIHTKKAIEQNNSRDAKRVDPQKAFENGKRDNANPAPQVFFVDTAACGALDSI